MQPSQPAAEAWLCLGDAVEPHLHTVEPKDKQLEAKGAPHLRHLLGLSKRPTTDSKPTTLPVNLPCIAKYVVTIISPVTAGQGATNHHAMVNMNTLTMTRGASTYSR